MKTRIVSVRIPAAQASGAFNIDLPTGFGVPKGYLVYAQDNFATPIFLVGSKVYFHCN